MNMNSLSFRPVQGSEQKIKAQQTEDGRIYFATDTGKIFLDTNGKRISVGGAGAAIYYGDTILPTEIDEEYFLIEDLVNPLDSPSIGDIILNVDGAFYKVERIDGSNYICTRLAVSGSGGGGEVQTRPTLSVEDLESPDVINGSDVRVYFTATSAKDASTGEVLNPELTISWSLYEGDAINDGDVAYDGDTMRVPSGERSYLDFGSRLRKSTTSTLRLVASGSNHDKSSAKRDTVVSTTDMTLRMESSFSNTTVRDPDGMKFRCYAEGQTDRILEIEFDGTVYDTIDLKKNDAAQQDIVIDKELGTHGVHTVKLTLYKSVNGKKGQAVDPIEFELAVKEPGNEIPLVWFGTYQKVYYTYDLIQIPYLAYDPASPSKTNVYLYKNDILYKDDIRVVDEYDEFIPWTITDADNEMTNTYQIACGTTDDIREKSKREIIFDVVQDPRDMSPSKSTYLKLEFNPEGRTNNESATKRKNWVSKDGTVKAIFENFNWYNNGWLMDSNKKTFLRISNGAKFTLPIGSTKFAGTTDSTQSHTFEIQFKIRNIQDYSNLIKNITRYNFVDEDGQVIKNDEEYYNQFIAQVMYDNYDAFLQAKLGSEYDKLVFSYVQKVISLNNVACGYYSGSGGDVLGWCLGPQDAFFRDGANTINVSYVEDELITLSIVYKYNSSGKSMIYIYLNGVVTGVAFANSTAFTVSPEDLGIVLSSEKCDIDLYKIRVYNTDLSVYDIVRNFAIDHKDIITFDQGNLVSENDKTGEYELQFSQVEQWNKDNPSNPLMPYIIYDTTKRDDQRLPWSKKTSIPITVTFVNTPLERAYASGRLKDIVIEEGLCKKGDSADIIAAAVKTYYKYHCPSWTGDNVELVVQGTSSEYYPRRNYKIKTKTEYDDDGVERIHIFLNQGPFAEDYNDDPESTRQKFWYMNNYTNGTHKWTMKVDYMESSGSYNAGYASLVGNAYSKHPLKDYVDNNIIDPYKKDEDTREYLDKDGKVVTVDRDENGVITDTSKLVNLLENDTTGSIRWQDFRTSLLGFPVMAFHKYNNNGEEAYRFIGYYRMLLDKGSDEVLGLKPAKTVTQTLLKDKDVRKKAECWEFSNNNRTYCSYRDPWDRTQLSFMPPEDKIADETGLTAAGVPIVADSFEYRYNDNEDAIDILYGLGKKDGGNWVCAAGEDDINYIKEECGIDISNLDEWPAARAQLIDYYKNWEEVCQWIWSTCTDNVVGMGSYQSIKLGTDPYAPGVYYIKSGDGYVQESADSVFNWEEEYYIQETETAEDGSTSIKHTRVYLYDTEDKKYVPNKFYQSIDGVYSLDSSLTFNPDTDYFILTVDESYKTKSDLLVAPATEYKDGVTYYNYDPSVTTTQIRNGEKHAVTEATGVTADNVTDYYVATPVNYGSEANPRIYEYDTKEYRAEKFINELSSHFDLEYLATYFIMTEVFECYDSRGKNCMMASWGPKVKDGAYIWYPIFYDIDTQLGINNTGIPSFEFNIDATKNNNFSTSDSILWNNLYSYFKGSYILQKYRHLKGLDSTIFSTPLANPPLKSVDYLESWYTFNPDATKNIATEGLRPLLATNLDEWYKYITITNPVGNTDKDLLASGVVGYLNRGGEYVIDGNGTYFYALQGDRAQSRQAFLTKRIDYIDSWLGVDDYERSGSNCIWGRVSANDATDTSDVWLEEDESSYGEGGTSYWFDKEETIKRHPFDAQYWLDLKPIYSTYITVSDDAAAYPSVKYDGKTPVQFKVDAIESGVRKSKDYKEQLLYIYGSDKMLDIGDMNNLYWREFKIDGKASKLTRLKLGHDALVEDYNEAGEKVMMPWKNGYLNQPSIPSGSTSTGMPLLKEVNLSNITIQAGAGTPTMDFSSCEKLENFRATGTNLTQIEFAKGVSLNTLYFPKTAGALSLTEANLLTDVLTHYEQPVLDDDGVTINATPGLYIEGFFENQGNDLKQINLNGGSLKYGSYMILEKFYNLRKGSEGNRLTMTGVNWCPYVQLVDGDEYDSSKQYFVDNNHYNFSPYTHVDEAQFKSAIVRGEIYMLNEEYRLVHSSDNYESMTYYVLNEDKEYEKYNYSNDETLATDIKNGLIYIKYSDLITYDGYGMVKDLITNTGFNSFEDSEIKSNLSGIIYINNDEDNKIDEFELSDTMQKAYPEMKFFAKNVKSAYSARFVMINDDGSYSYIPFADGSTIYNSIQKVSQADFDNGTTTKFENPFEMYNPTNSKTHYDFIGWTTSYNPDLVNYSDVLLIEEADNWGTNYKNIDWGIITKDNYDQIYYAVFKETTYTATFLDAMNSDYQQEVSLVYDPDIIYFNDNVLLPVSITEQEGPLEERHTFKGWTLNSNYAKVYEKDDNIKDYLVNIERQAVIKDYTFYAIYQKESVYDSPTDAKYFDVVEINDSNLGSGWQIFLKPETASNLTGKITLPITFTKNNVTKDVVSVGGNTNAQSTFAYGGNIEHVFFMPNGKYKSIGAEAFGNSAIRNRTLKGVYLPDTITYIGESAFRQTLSLETVNLNDNITYIGNHAFNMGSAGSIKVNKLPTNLEYLGNSAFYQGGDGVVLSDIPDKITAIQDATFYRCKNVTINVFGALKGEIGGSKLTSIGERVFYQGATTTGYNDDISAIWILDSITDIGQGAFTNYGVDDIPINVTYSEADASWVNNAISESTDNINFDQTYTG